MKFHELIEGLRPVDGGWSVEITEDWLQGRSAFGGLQAALAVRAMRSLVPAGLPLRTLQVTFLAPVPQGRAHITAQVLRQGKNTTHVEARLTDGAQPLCVLIGIFGMARESSIHIAPLQPAVQAVTRPFEFRFIPGLTPNFTRHYTMRWLRGQPPFTGSREADAVIEVGYAEPPPGPTTVEHLVALADVIPPAALSLLNKPAPGSSMTWTLEFLRDDFGALPLSGWRFDVSLPAAGGGYTSQSVIIWGPGGEPVALSRQNMVVFG